LPKGLSCEIKLKLENLEIENIKWTKDKKFRIKNLKVCISHFWRVDNGLLIFFKRKKGGGD